LEQTSLSATPSDYPLQFSADGRSVHLLQLGPEDYRAASFLDQRLLTRAVPERWATWTFAEGADAPERPQMHFIFHQGHVGSTLLSRLLGEHADLFSLREPALLREVAHGRRAERLPALLALYARTWRPGQTSLIKATSFVSAIGSTLLEASTGQTLLLGVTLPVYLRSILAGPNSRREADDLADGRRIRLATRLGAPVQADTPGARLALGWLVEAVALSDMQDQHPGRCLRLDFDRLLAAPLHVLTASLEHLGADPGGLDLEGLVRGPILQRYSKGPEHAYDAGLRRQLLEEAGREQASTIQEGMSWLQGMVDAYPQTRAPCLRAAAAARGVLATG
jgi:hypothetical protein